MSRAVHVLLVDDNEEVLQTFAELLEAEGFRVTTCASGLVALLRIGREIPDIIILDLTLTDTSGFEIHRALKMEPAFAGIPILFVSGVVLDEDLVRARVGDPRARLLMKPVSSETLISAISEAILSSKLSAA
jgi:CheY-like chemotaxis protein